MATLIAIAIVSYLAVGGLARFTAPKRHGSEPAAY